jgi:hypothetical protein
MATLKTDAEVQIGSSWNMYTSSGRLQCYIPSTHSRSAHGEVGARSHQRPSSLAHRANSHTTPASPSQPRSFPALALATPLAKTVTGSQY